MTLSNVRTHLKTAVGTALNDAAWVGTDKIPLNPDDPAYWVRFPNDARRTTLTAGLEYEIRVSFCVGLNDTDLAQDALNVIYEPVLWAAIEGYTTSPMPWHDIHVLRLDEPYQLQLDDGRKMLAVDMPIDIYT